VSNISTGSTNGIVALLPGRAIKFAPPWDCADAVVAFDANSGDYWLVATLAYDIIRIVQSHADGIPIPALAEQLTAAHIGEDLPLALLPTLHSLVDNQLLQPADWYTRRVLPMDDADD
jgi:hypothetical protein